MSKLLASALAASLVIAGMATAQAMPVSRFDSIKSGQMILVSELMTDECQTMAGNCAPRVHRRWSRSFGQRDFPYMPSRFNVSGYDAGENQYCGFGSYVACAYSGTYCWRRCN